jgi:hypothetical protein
MMLKRIRSCLFLLISFAGAAHAAPPAKLVIAWELTRNATVLADIVQTLEYSAGRYELSETWKGRGLFALRGSVKRASRGNVVPEGLRPLEYSDERTGRDTERASFDWAAKTVTYQYQGPPKTIPLPPFPHDRLAFMFQFAFKPPRTQEVVLDVIDGRGISDQIYRVEGREKMTITAGEFEIVKLVRRKEGNERAEIWLAADRSYLPVRILIVTKDGTVLDQVATRIHVQ